MKAPFRVSLLLLLSATWPAGLHAQSEPPHVQEAPTQTPREELVALVTRTLKAWENPDPAGFLQAFAEDVFFAYPGGQADKSGLAAIFSDLQARKTGVKIYVGPFLVLGNEFVVRYQFACTDRQTGKRQAVGTAVRGTLRDGRIVKFKEYWDAHIAVDQASCALPLDEGKPDFPAPASVLMTPQRIN